MGWSVRQSPKSEEGRFLGRVKDGVSVGRKEVDKVVRCFGVLVEVVVMGPERVVEVEIAEEDSSLVKRVVGEGGYHVDCCIVCVVVHVDDEEGVCARFNLEAHDCRVGDDVGPLLEGPGGSMGGDVSYYVRRRRGRARRGKYGLPVLVFRAAVLVSDWVTLGHLSIDSDAPVPRFLNKNKVSRRRKRGGVGENSV